MRFRFDFVGCKRGAIGIHYPITAEAVGADAEAAKLALYDRYDHISGAKHVRLMFAPTYVNKNGMRTLMQGNQGRNHFETHEAAKEWLDAVMENTPREKVVSIWGKQAIDTFEVRQVECYDHGDARSIWFD